MFFRRARAAIATPPPFIQYVAGHLGTTPGAMIFGYESEMLAMRPMIGPAIGQGRQWCSVFPAPQAYQAIQTMWQTGLTGVVHGQSALQPLSNPYAS